VLSNVQVTPDHSKLGPLETEYFKIVIGDTVGGTVLRLLFTIPDVLMTLFVSLFLNFNTYSFFNPELKLPYEPVGPIRKNGAVSSTLNLSIAVLQVQQLQ
jgi:hypothetical protein